jgi:long-subunit fatty acid transport protein
MAWENYLIDVSNPGTGDDQYKAYFLQSNENVKQIESVHREGFNNEYIASLGANFNHTLYLGATIGMQDLFYDEAKLYSESGITTSSLKSWGKFDYSNNSRITGIGYNLKLGAIYRPIPALRIGIALHTPTYFHFKETYSSIMNSTLTDINTNANGSHSEVTPIGNYEYNFHSPLRAIGSVAYQIAKKAMLSLDYELVDYGSMKYSKGLGGDNFSVENDEIKTIYNAVSNVRIGAEVRLTDAFSVRGGLEYLGNPYKSVINNIPQPNTNFNFKTYNGGIGYRSGKFSIDMTYSVGDKTNYMYLYQIDGVTVDPVKYRAISSELMFTVAMRM